MPLLKDGKIVEDSWTHLEGQDPIPETGAVVVSLDRLLLDHNVLVSRSDSVGVRLNSEQSPELIKDHLEELSLVELEFPAFTDGRAYSYARLLHRYGFSGEIRAVGNVLRDQYRAMQRCGFTSLEIGERETELDWIKATGEFSASYQVAHDSSLPIMSLREQRLAAQ